MRKTNFFIFFKFLISLRRANSLYLAVAPLGRHLLSMRYVPPRGFLNKSVSRVFSVRLHHGGLFLAVRSSVRIWGVYGPGTPQGLLHLLDVLLVSSLFLASDWAPYTFSITPYASNCLFLPSLRSYLLPFTSYARSLPWVFSTAQGLAGGAETRAPLARLPGQAPWPGARFPGQAP